jgi:hypothetical protein
MVLDTTFDNPELVGQVQFEKRMNSYTYSAVTMPSIDHLVSGSQRRWSMLRDDEK